MSLEFAINGLELNRVPDQPGAVVLFDDANALYVAQTANMRAWTRRLLDPQRIGYAREAIAKYLTSSRAELIGLRELRGGLNEQIQDFLGLCHVRIHPEDSREAAVKRKTELITLLAPRLQARQKRAPSDDKRHHRAPPDDPIRTLLKTAGELAHLDAAGRPRMVDVSAKQETAREATAKGSVYMSAETLALITSGRAAKGDVLTTAQVAGIMAAKRTHDLIPLCHPLPLTGIEVTLEPDAAHGAVNITATVRTTAKTGVEMEALTAVSVAALTVYDMAKAAQKDMRISDIRLVRKTGGKSGDIQLE